MKELTHDQILSILFKRFPSSGKIYKDDDESSKLFILRFWIDEVNTVQGKTPRYKTLDESSFIRKQIDDVLKSHVVDERYVRFHEETKVKVNAIQHAYVSLRSIN